MDGELSPTDFAALLDGPKRKSREMSPDEFTSFLDGIAPPEPPGKLQAFGGSLLESLGAVPQTLAAVTDYMGGAAPEHGYGARGPLPSWGPSGQPPTTYAQGPQIGQEVFGPAGQALQQASQAVYPEEQRGRGGLGEQLASGAGSIAGALPALMGGPVAAGVQFGAAQGIPLYHEIKKSTGDEEAAMWGLLFGGAVGQLDQLPGAKQALGGIVKKLASSELKDVVVHSVLGSALKHAATQAGVGAMQRTLSMALQEKLTGKDIDIWNQVKAGLPADLIFGGGFGALDAAISRIATPAEGGAARLGATPKVDLQESAPEVGARTQEPTETTSAVELPETATAEPQAGPVEAPEVQPTSSATGTSHAEPATRPGSVSASEPSVPRSRREELTTRKPHELTADEAEEAYQLQRAHDKGADVEVLGEAGAKEWDRLHRLQDSMNAEVADRASDRIAEIEADLTEAQRNRLYGIGEKGMGAETLRELSSSLGDVRGAVDEHELGRIVGKSLADVGQGDPETFAPGSREALAAAKLAEAGRVIRERGLDSGKVSEAALNRAKEIYGDDAPEMLRRWLPQEGAQTPKPEAPSEYTLPASPERAKFLTAGRELELRAKTQEQLDRAHELLLAMGEKPWRPILQDEPIAGISEQERREADYFGGAGHGAPPEAPPEKTVELLAGLPPIKEGAPQEHAAEATGRVKEALYEGLIKTHGGKPELAARLEERSKGEVNAAALEARGNVRAVKRAIRQHAKATGETLAPERIQEAMQSPKAMAALPDAVRPHVAKMRDQADRLSRILVSEGMTDKTMAQAIQGRMGKYLRTSYQAHSDPAWAKKVPQDVRNRLKSLLVSWSEPLRPEKLAELEQRQANEKLPTMERRKAEFELGSRRALQGKDVGEIEAEMQALLDDAKATAENPWAALANSNLKRKDLSIFKARKGLPDELKAFLGEEKDPYANYTNTILKQASFVANHRKLKAIRDVGIGKWLFEKPTIQEGKNYTVRVSAADNPRLAPLVGDSELYTTEKIKKALFDSQPSYSKGWKWAMAANAAIKGTKTIYQLHAVPKQAVSQITALLKNGHIGYALANAKGIVRAMSGADKEAQLELTRLGILGESVAAAEFRDVKEQFTGKKIAPAYQGLARANDLIGAAFGKPDDFSKVAGFYAETAALKKAGFSEAQAKEHAANIVRNLYPTYSRITRWVDKFRRQPLVGTFMAFKAEQVRTNFERLKLIGEELKSGNEVLATRAKKRIGYLLAGQAAAPAAAVAWNMLNGVDSDEDDDRRLFVPEWDQQRNLVWEGGDKKGTYTDLSDIDEGSWLTDPLLRIADGEDASKVLGEMYREDVEPFASFSLLSKMAIEYVRGEKMDGTPIDDRAAYLREQLTPSSIRNFDPRGLSGLRPVEFDVEKSLGISTGRFAREIADLTGKRHRMERRSPGEKASIVGEQEQSRKELFQTLSDQARAAVRLGMPYSKVKGILDASLSSEMTDAVLSGRYIKYTEKKKR